MRATIAINTFTFDNIQIAVVWCSRLLETGSAVATSAKETILCIVHWNSVCCVTYLYSYRFETQNHGLSKSAWANSRWCHELCLRYAFTLSVLVVTVTYIHNLVVLLPVIHSQESIWGGKLRLRFFKIEFSRMFLRLSILITETTSSRVWIWISGSPSK